MNVMNLIWSVFLGIVQGLTEFLPVSSSGHLVILQHFIPGFSQPGVLFDVILHLGTVFSVIYFFRKNIIRYILSNFWIIFIGTIPAGIIGFFFNDFFESMFGNIRLVGFALLITAFLNHLTYKAKERGEKISFGKSLFVGAAQAIAIIPGISRSGSTIFAGSILGIDKKKAAEFSFMLSIPAVLGANILQFFKYRNFLSFEVVPYSIGFLFSFLFGVIAIKVVLRNLSTKGFKYFAYYALLVGLLALII